jgi:hypothetical protein
MSYTPVKPGDLITAAFFNQVLGSFDQRISALEAASQGAGQIVIQQLLPLGNFYVGNQMHIVGQNFGNPANVVVTVGGQQVTSFAAGSGNTDLYFDIPAVQGLSQAGTMVTLVVDNSTSPAPATTSFTLYPVQQTSPSGNVLVSMTGPPAVKTITPGNTYTYIFTATGYTSLTDNYTVTVTLDAASQADGWTAAPTSSVVKIPQGQATTTQVGVNVTVPGTVSSPPAVLEAQVTVTLTSSLKPGTSGTGATTVTANAQPATGNAIALTIFNVGAGATKSADGSTVTVSPGTSTTTIIFLATLPDGGTGVSYSVSPLTFDSGGWVATLQSPSDISVGTPNSTAQIRFSISVPSTASSTQMHLTVTEDNKPSVQGTQTFSISV